MTLREWPNAEETGRYRFRPSVYYCPKCGQKVLNDEWPPNYGGGNSGFSPAGGPYISECGGTQKCVCLNCKLAFKVHTWEKRVDGHIVESIQRVLQQEPLVEKDGYLLTPHDMRREQYKEEHGEYPVEVYG